MTEYKKIITNKGLELITSSSLNGEELVIKSIVIGDANGENYEPTAAQTSLVHQKNELQISEMIVNSETSYTFLAQIPNDIDYYLIREIGLLDENDNLLEIAQMEQETYIQSDNLIQQLTVGIRFDVGQSSTVIVLADTNIEIASKDFVNNNFQNLNQKGQSNGYAGLDANCLIPIENLPELDYASINLSDLSSDGNAKFQYAPFSINNGTVDVNGDNLTLYTPIEPLYHKRNINVIGTLTTNNSVISGFSTSNYAVLPQNFDVSGGKTWEMVFEVTTGNNISTNQSIIGTSGISTNKDPVVILLYQNKFGAQITYTATGIVYDFYANNITINPNTTYLIKLEFTGTAYNLYINGVLGASLTSSTSIYTSSLVLGIQSGSGGSLSNPWDYSIDLNNSYIKINNQTWWQGIINGTSSDYDYSILSGTILISNPCTITTADNRTKAFTTSATLNCSTLANGTYKVLKDYEIGALSTISNLTIAKVEPSSPSEEDYWLDTSKTPLVLKTYDGSAWVIDNDKVYLGNITIENATITAIKNNVFNQYKVDEIVGIAHELDFANATSITTTSIINWASYTATDDGILFVSADGSNTTLDARIMYDNTTYTIGGYYRNSNSNATCFPMIKGQSVKYVVTGTNVNVRFVPYKKA